MSVMLKVVHWGEGVAFPRPWKFLSVHTQSSFSTRRSQQALKPHSRQHNVLGCLSSVRHQRVKWNRTIKKKNGGRGNYDALNHNVLCVASTSSGTMDSHEIHPCDWIFLSFDFIWRSLLVSKLPCWCFTVTFGYISFQRSLAAATSGSHLPMTDVSTPQT